MASSSYEVIVLGNDFAGLVCASLCAARGMRVLLAEIDKQVDSYKVGNETLPIGILDVCGLDSPGFDRVIDELHFHHLLRRRLEDVEPPCQLVHPNLRLEAHPDPLRFDLAFEREVGKIDSWWKEADEVQSRLSQLLAIDACFPPTGFWERREFGRLVEQASEGAASWQALEHHDASRQLGALTSLALTGRIEDQALPLARAMSVARSGIARIDGHWQAWRNLFLDKFRSHNGEIRRVDARSIPMSWGKVTGLSCVDDKFACDHLVAALSVGELALLLGKKAPKKLHELDAEIETLAYRYTLNVVVKTSGIPEGMSRALWSRLDPEASPIGGNFASFAVQPAKRGGYSIVTIEGLAPVAGDGGPDLTGMRSALLDHMRGLMPFVDAHVDIVDSPHEDAKSKTKRDLGALVAPKPVWRVPVEENTGMPGLPYQPGPKHLIVASSQSLPNLGVEGEIIAGWSAAKIASAGLAKKKPSAKPSVLAESR